MGAASVAEISRINILQASLLAMRRAVARLRIVPDLALVDGNQAPPLPCPVRCVIGGDAACLSIAAASIVAKVVRDRAMRGWRSGCPLYGWHSNAGYGTAAHRAAIALHGPSRHHRPTFGAVRLHLARRTWRDCRRRLTRLPGVRHIVRQLEGANAWKSSANCRWTRCCWATACA